MQVVKVSCSNHLTVAEGLNQTGEKPILSADLGKVVNFYVYIYLLAKGDNNFPNLMVRSQFLKCGRHTETKQFSLVAETLARG